MATLAFDERPSEAPASDHRFAATMAIVMALVVVAGFSNQFLSGRSTFAAPLRVHVHAVVFMGWVGLFVTQTWLATRGPLALHRRLGWLAAGWMVLMVVVGLSLMLAVVRNGTAAFFFKPQHFLIANSLGLLGFAGLTAAAVAMRRRTDWHARLHLSAMSVIMGPAFGRLLPMPLLAPYAFQAAVMASTVFLAAGMIRDRRRLGRVHRAWWWGLATLVLTLVAAEVLAASRFGDWVYASAVAGSPGAQVPGMEFGNPPTGALISGR